MPTASTTNGLSCLLRRVSHSFSANGESRLNRARQIGSNKLARRTREGSPESSSAGITHDSTIAGNSWHSASNVSRQNARPYHLKASVFQAAKIASTLRRKSSFNSRVASSVSVVKARLNSAMLLRAVRWSKTPNELAK